jgi:hypothetical protein
MKNLNPADLFAKQIQDHFGLIHPLSGYNPQEIQGKTIFKPIYEDFVPICLPLENRACVGTRVSIDSSVVMNYPFQFELGFHYGKGQFEITIYYYNHDHPTYPQRLAHSIEKWTQDFFPSIDECLNYFEKTITLKYGTPVKVVRDWKILIKK